MKLSMFLFALILSTSSFAGLLVTCHEGENKIEISDSSTKTNSKSILSVFNAGGLGPQFLEASYSGKVESYVMTPNDQFYYKAHFTMGGVFEVAFESNEFDNGKGQITYPFTENAVLLEDCTYSLSIP